VQPTLSLSLTPGTSTPGLPLQREGRRARRRIRRQQALAGMLRRLTWRKPRGEARSCEQEHCKGKSRGSATLTFIYPCRCCMSTQRTDAHACLQLDGPRFGALESRAGQCSHGAGDTRHAGSPEGQATWPTLCMSCACPVPSVHLCAVQVFEAFLGPQPAITCTCNTCHHILLAG
jgi:hypothetical protein